jgi:hypothetical protein
MTGIDELGALLHPEEYSAEETAGLYRQRWQAELHLRIIKIVLQMDHLHCKTPERVRNEIWLNAFLPMLHGGIDLDCWCRSLLAVIASHAVGNRTEIGRAHV